MNLLPLQHIKGFGTLGKCPLKFPEDPSAMHSEFSEEQGDTLDPWHNLVSGMPPFCAQASQRIKSERGFSPEHKSGLRPGISFWLSAGVMIVSLASSPLACDFSSYVLALLRETVHCPCQRPAERSPQNGCVGRGSFDSVGPEP